MKEPKCHLCESELIELPEDGYYSCPNDDCPYRFVLYDLRTELEEKLE